MVIKTDGRMDGQNSVVYVIFAEAVFYSRQYVIIMHLIFLSLSLSFPLSLNSLWANYNRNTYQQIVEQQFFILPKQIIRLFMHHYVRQHINKTSVCVCEVISTKYDAVAQFWRKLLIYYFISAFSFNLVRLEWIKEQSIHRLIDYRLISIQIKFSSMAEK